MVRGVFLFLLALAAPAIAQTCTTYVMVDPFNSKTERGIDGLTAERFQASMGNTSLPVVSATQSFNNRVLVLTETSGSADNKEIDALVRGNRRQGAHSDSRMANRLRSICRGSDYR